MNKIKKAFNNKLNMLKQAKIDKNNDNRIIYSWIWEFSKKVVFAIFLIYILNSSSYIIYDNNIFVKKF